MALDSATFQLSVGKKYRQVVQRGGFSLVVDGFGCKPYDATIKEADLDQDRVVDGEMCL